MRLSFPFTGPGLDQGRLVWAVRDRASRSWGRGLTMSAKAQRRPQELRRPLLEAPIALCPDTHEEVVPEADTASVLHRSRTCIPSRLHYRRGATESLTWRQLVTTAR